MSEVVLTTDSCRITDRLQCRMTKRAMGPKAGSAALRRGLLWTFAFLMSTAAASVYLGRLLRTIGPLLVILTSFFGLSFFFFATQLSADRSFARIWGRAIAGWHDLVALNLATLAAWMGFYYALWFGIEPAIYGAIAYAAQPFVTSAVILSRTRGFRTTLRDVACAVGILLGVGWLVYNSYAGRSAVGHLPLSSSIMGLVFTSVSSIGIAGNAVTITRLARRGFTFMELMATRFLLLIVAAAALSPLEARIPDTRIQWLSLLVAALSVGIPAICYQRGVQTINDPYMVSLCISTLPIFQLFFEVLDSNLHLGINSCLGVIVAVAFAALGILSRRSER